VVAQVSLDGSLDSLRKNEDEKGILESQAFFHSLIQQEVDAGIPADRIVLGGFSQGGAMALFSGLTSPVRIAGIVGLSSYLLLSLKFRELVPKPQPNQDTPILMGHGDLDSVVPFKMGELSKATLSAMGYNVTWKVYE
jgi:lysophospholipase I